jgi:hypothetical protein
VEQYETSHEVFEALRRRHENFGVYAQVLIKKALEVSFDINTLMSHTLTEIKDLHGGILNLGPIDLDELFSVFVIDALGDKFSHLQLIYAMKEEPGFSSGTLIRRNENEEFLIQHWAEQGLSHATLNPLRLPLPPLQRTKVQNHLF